MIGSEENSGNTCVKAKLLRKDIHGRTTALNNTQLIAHTKADLHRFFAIQPKTLTLVTFWSSCRPRANRTILKRNDNHQSHKQIDLSHFPVSITGQRSNEAANKVLQATLHRYKMSKVPKGKIAEPKEGLYTLR